MPDPLKKKEVRRLKLGEVSHVDKPSNRQSLAALWKREATKGGESMDPEEIAKKAKELETQVSELTKSNEALTKTVASLTESAKAAGLSVEGDKIVKSAPTEYVELDGQKIAKSDIHPAVLAHIEKADREKRELIQKAEETALLKRADDEVPNLVGTAAERAALLKAVDSVADETVREALKKSLKAADEAMKSLTKAAGSDSGKTSDEDSDDAEKLDLMVEETAKKKGISKSEAYAEVMKSAEGRKLAASGMKKTK